MPKRIRAIGLDADGCIYNQKFINLLSEEIRKFGLNDLNQAKIFEIVLIANKEFLENIVSDNKKYDKTILCITSNRQSHYIDYNNSEKLLKHLLKNLNMDYSNIDPEYVNMLSFSKITNMLSNIILNPHRGDYFDSSLLADLFGFCDIDEDLDNKKLFSNPLIPSTASNISIITPNYDNHPIAPLDYSKTLLLCNLLRKLRKDNPDADIIFDMFDDRCSLIKTPPPEIEEFPHRPESSQELVKEKSFKTFSEISIVSSSLEPSLDGTRRQSSALIIDDNAPTLDIVAHYMSSNRGLLNRIQLNLFYYNGQTLPEQFKIIESIDLAFSDLDIDDIAFAKIIQEITIKCNFKLNKNINGGEGLDSLSSKLPTQDSEKSQNFKSEYQKEIEAQLIEQFKLEKTYSDSDGNESEDDDIDVIPPYTRKLTMKMMNP